MDNKSLLSFAALSCIAATAQAQQKAAAATQLSLPYILMFKNMYNDYLYYFTIFPSYLFLTFSLF